MAQPLEAFVQFEKSVRKMAKKKLKRLRKRAKKARKKKRLKLSEADAREQLRDAFSLFDKHINTAVSREFGESDVRVDLVVEGELLLEQVPPRVLVTLRKQAKYVRKAAKELVKLHGDEFKPLASRASRLEEAITETLREANERPVEERPVSDAVVSYLRG
jgi:hypothetical protein